MNYYVDKDSKELFKAFLALESVDEAKKFLRDLLTEAEIKEFAVQTGAKDIIEFLESI